jgi:ABC-2 type transport system permease protein
MSKAWEIAKVMLIELMRDRAAWVTMLLVPILLTFIMGAVFGGGGTQAKKTMLPVVDQDNTAYSKLVIEQLKQEKVLDVVKKTEIQAKEDVQKSKVAAAVVIPKGFEEAMKTGKTAKLEMLQLADNNSALAIVQILDGLAIRLSTDITVADETSEFMKERGGPGHTDEAQRWTKAFDTADKAWDEPVATVKAQSVKESDVKGDNAIAFGFTQTSMGFTVTFVMFMLISGATTILEERQKRTLGRILTTPTAKSIFLGGKIFGLLLTGGIQAAILIFAGRFLFNVDWGKAPLPLLVLMTVFIFSVASMGILIASLARTTAQAQSISPILIISMAMLGGCYWPVEITPPFMQFISKITPPGWMMKGLVDLIVRGHGWDAIFLPGLVLAGFGIVFLGIGVSLLRFE